MQIIPTKIKITAIHCKKSSFSLYTNLPYKVVIKGLENVNAATILTSYISTPKLKNRVPIAPKKAMKKIYLRVLVFGRSKEVLVIFKLIPLDNTNPNSMIKEVNAGPNTITGILNRKYTRPHNTHEIRANGTPLEILNRWEFFKSLKSSEINTIPLIIARIEIICVNVNDSLKKTIESKIIKITDELAMGDIIPTLPTFNAL